MKLIKWSVAGLIGGLISAAIWAGISYATGYEIGWIAWLVGIVVGICVRVAAGDDEGFLPGSLAVVISILAILAGKYFAVSLIVDRELAKHVDSISVTPEEMQISICREVLAEWKQAKKKLKWPPGQSEETITSTSSFPLDIREEAAKRWTALGTEEQQKRINESKEAIREISQILVSGLKEKLFKESFSGFDILFFILAIGSAFKAGSGMQSDEE